MNNSSSWGTALAFALWASILFLFAAWPGEPDALVWMARTLALLSLLVAILGGCTELAKTKNGG